MTPRATTRPSRATSATTDAPHPEPRAVATIVGHAELGPGDSPSKRLCNAAYRSLSTIYIACENAPVRKIDLASAMF